jgi:polysaccharide biosynthesis/export protein
MTARMLTAPRRRRILLLAGLLPVLAAGCQAMCSAHASKKHPDYGIIDPDQPRELQMVSMPPYVVEPPDETCAAAG